MALIFTLSCSCSEGIWFAVWDLVNIKDLRKGTGINYVFFELGFDKDGHDVFYGWSLSVFFKSF